MSGLRIGIVAPLWAPVPPTTYGGIERHLQLLADELVRRGHQVTLFASGDSSTSADLKSVLGESVAERMDRGEAYFYEHYANASLAEALRASGDFDLLHVHLGTGVVPLCELAQCAVLHTIHTGVTLDDLWIWQRYPKARFTALSSRQLADVPQARRDSIDVVHYGFDFDTCAPKAAAAQHLAFLGRMAPHKGPDVAIRIARATGRPIQLAGAPVTPEDRGWFEREIQAQLDPPRIVWKGPIDDAGKDALFEGAAALVFPIDWEEPFGLVMLEALARGVPILATRRGSVPEVVEHGVTGFIEDDPDALAQHVEAAAQLDRDGVRERARQRFSIPTMVDGYEAAYQRARSS